MKRLCILITALILTTTLFAGTVSAVEYDCDTIETVTESTSESETVGDNEEDDSDVQLPEIIVDNSLDDENPAEDSGNFTWTLPDIFDRNDFLPSWDSSIVPLASNSGQCGDNAYWNYNASTGVLTISGAGSMYDFEYFEWAPWYDISGIKSISVLEGITSIGSCAFYNCSDVTNVTLPSSLVEIKYDAFRYCESLTSIVIPDSVQSIGGSAFEYCKNLTSVRLPDNLTDIPSWLFFGCTSLQSVNIPNPVKSIGRSAFDGCSALKSITLPANLTTIQYKSFIGCSSLAEVTIPASVQTIEEGAFRGSDNQEIYFEGSAPTAYEYGPMEEWGLPRYRGSFDSDDTLYYKPDTAGWTDSEYYDAVAGTWHGYKLLPWIQSPYFSGTTLYWPFNANYYYTVTCLINDTIIESIGYTNKGVKSVDLSLVVDHLRSIDKYGPNAKLTFYIYGGTTAKPAATSANLIGYATYNALALGDINGDGKVDVQDGVLMQRILAKLETNADYLLRADLNNDGKVDVQDGVKMQRILAHLE